MSVRRQSSSRDEDGAGIAEKASQAAVLRSASHAGLPATLASRVSRQTTPVAMAASVTRWTPPWRAPAAC